MSGLFSCRAFTGFGPSRLEPSSQAPQLHQVQGSRPGALRRQLRERCLKRPGVYGMLDGDGLLVYVGKAKHLRGRLFSYFRPRSRDPKAGRIVRIARTIVWEYQPSEFAALLRELELIQRWQPRLNIHGQPLRRLRTYICLGRKPAPYAFLARRPPAGALASFGPVPAGRKAREAVRWINDWFGLRDCPQSQSMIFADQSELFPVLRAAGCLRYEIGTCLGPCVAGCSQESYYNALRAANAFLAGSSAEPLNAVEKQMAAAASAFQFERAAMLRDKRAALAWLRGHLDRLREARQRHTFIYRMLGHEGKELWYLIRHGKVEAVIAAPIDAESERRAAEVIESVYHPRHPHREPREAAEIDAVFLVSAWFRKHASEWEKTSRA